MKKLFLAAIVFAVVFTSCVPKSRLQDVEERLDSLAQVNAIYEEDMMNMTQFIDALAISIDSIAVSEDILLMTEDGYGRKSSRYQMMQNLTEFEALLSRQKDRINELDSILSVRMDSTSTMRVLLNHYKGQLNDKEVYITGLKHELNKKTKRIRTLETQVTHMSGEIEKLNEEAAQMETVLQIQTDYINKGYFWIASKKEMKNYGVLKGLSKVDLSKAPASEFIEVDIRNFTEISISSPVVKILSPVPASSYYIESYNDGTSVLKVLNPTSFWSLSTYLVIQTK